MVPAWPSRRVAVVPRSERMTWNVSWNEKPAQSAEIGDLSGANGQCPHALDELGAGSAGKKLGLPLEQRLPYGVVAGGVAVPALIDGPVVVGRRRDHCRWSAVTLNFIELSKHGYGFSSAPRRQYGARALAKADATKTGAFAMCAQDHGVAVFQKTAAFAAGETERLLAS